MPTVLYCHGFLSSPQSKKALQVKQWLRGNKENWHYICPNLSPYPSEARATITNIVNDLRLNKEPFYCIGSSLGGYWATWITENFGVKSALINPAVAPHTRFARLINQPIKSYYSEQQYVLKKNDLDDLSENDQPIIRQTSQYFVLLQTGDETLDYRDAQARYKGSKMIIETGGNHSFVGFEKHLPKIADFFLGD